MKLLKIMTFVVAFLCLPKLYGQINFGLKGGMHTVLLDDNTLSLGNIGDFVIDSKYGFQFGMFFNFGLGPVYIEPSLMFHTTDLEYTLDSAPTGQIFDASYKNLDIPLVLGYDFGFLRIFGGTVGHFHIDSASDLFEFDGYDEKFDGANFGFQAGSRFDLGKFLLEVKYEGNLSKFGEFIQIAGQEFQTDERSSRIIANIGFRF